MLNISRVQSVPQNYVSFGAKIKRPIKLNTEQIRNTLIALGYTPERASKVAPVITLDKFMDVIKAQAQCSLEALHRDGTLGPKTFCEEVSRLSKYI